MKDKVRDQLRKRKRKMQARISVENGVWQSPMIRPATTKMELAQKNQAVKAFALLFGVLDVLALCKRSVRTAF